MKNLRRCILTTLLMGCFSIVSAQEWTVIELPDNVTQVPAFIQEKFGCEYSELPTKYSITHLKFIGKDICGQYDWNEEYYYYREGVAALRSLAKNAVEIDLSELAFNPANVSEFRPDVEADEMLVCNILGGYLESLERFVYPKIQRIIWSTLENCPKLTEVVWPEELTTITGAVFTDCIGLKEMTVPAVVGSLPDRFFQNCSSLEKVTLPSTMESLGSGAFKGCKSLKSLELPADLICLGSSAFENCTDLTSLTLPDGVITVDASAFSGCTSLTSMTLPNGITRIGNYTFNGCTALGKVDVPRSLLEIGVRAFFGCTGLKTVELPDGITTIEKQAFASSGLESLVMPNSVTTIGESVFENCTALQSVRMSPYITVIPKYAFNNCSLLKNINMPSHVEQIGESAFANCISLDAITLYDGIEKLENSCFSKTGLPTITLPSTLVIIGNDCFAGSKLKSIDIPASVQQLGERAFSQCDELEDVTFHDGLYYVKRNCFYSCDKLGNVQLPNTVRVLGSEVFLANVSRTSFVLPPLINEVPDGICSDCTSLVAVTLHQGVKRIGNRAFGNCTSLSEIVIPEGVVTIGDRSFINCPLTSLNLPSSLREIDESAFNNGMYTEVMVPEGVEVIGKSAFYSKQLTRADFPSTIKAFKGLPLGDGPKLESVIVRAAVPPQTFYHGYYNPLFGVYERQSPLYVPAVSLAAYQNDDAFKGMASITGIDDSEIQSVVITKAATTADEAFPLINNSNLKLTYQDSSVGHLDISSKTNWSVDNLQYDYNYTDSRPTYWYDAVTVASLINEGTLTAQSMTMNLKPIVEEWFFFTPPFDVKASEIVCSSSRTPYVIRYFDGAQRAAGNHQNVWRNIAADETLKAGQGYILHFGREPKQVGYEEWTNVSENVTFTLKNTTPLRTYAFSNEAVTIPLTNYTGQYPHNMGWNLVGNPFMSYFDIQSMESDAPIVVWGYDENHNTYGLLTYSPLDDDLVLTPMQAFLIQCSDKLSSVTFAPEGRQHNDKVAQSRMVNARNMRRASLREQRIRYDITLHKADRQLSRTRLVLTPQATAGYDRGHDAPFFTMDEEQTALYTRSSGLRYSLNEQPLTTREVEVGMLLSEGGEYTLQVAVTGNHAEQPWLLDAETGACVDATEPYTFTVEEPSTINNRFKLRIGDNATEIPLVPATPQETTDDIYDLQGRKLTKGQMSKGIYIQKGKKIIY